MDFGTRKKKYITLRELADIYDGTFSYSSIRKWASERLFKVYPVTKKKVVTTLEDFERFIAERGQEAIDEKLRRITRKDEKDF